MGNRRPPASVQEPIRYHIPIRDWPEGERPREKLIQRGAEALSEAELIAIIFRTGTGRTSAVDLARALLQKNETLRRIARMNAPELMELHGIGQAKAVQLLAAFEIGRRLQTESRDDADVIRGPEDVARIMGPKLRDFTHEEFHVLLLDARNALRHEVKVTHGILNSSLVHPREVYKPAIDHRAAAIVVVHNHPSGSAEPSQEDISVTKQLKEAGSVIGIPLHDHVIIAGNSYTSLAERGLL